jgi:predicted nucleic acid-binding protein
MYLETTIFNFVFADNDPDKQKATLKLMAEISEGKYEAYTSALTIQELERADEPKRSNMLNLIRQFNIMILEENTEAVALADMYVTEDVIPQKYHDDAMHLAMATLGDIDILVSWNLKHIVKRKTIRLTNIINTREGYRTLEIFNPMEVIE